MAEENDATTVDETTTTSSVETKENDTTQVEAEDKKVEATVPFHEDPKIQDYINRQVEGKREEWIKEAEGKISERFAPKEETKVPAWFGGGDSSNSELVAQYKAFQQDIADMSEEKAKKAVEDYKTEQSKQSSLVDEANKYFEESISKVEADKELNPMGKKLSESDRNELMKFVYDNELIDLKGRWNYVKGFQFMNARKTKDPDNLDERKKLADLTRSDNKAETTPKDFKTSEDFKGGNRPW